MQLTQQINLKIERQSERSTALRYSILTWLVMQNSIHTLLIRYIRARAVENMFLASVAVASTEILKLFLCLHAVLVQERSIMRLFELLIEQVFKNPLDSLKVCLPAAIYTVQSNLFYLAASHLEAATFMVTSQLKIFTTAIFTVTMLRKILSKTKWFSIGILFFGVILVQVQQTSNRKVSSNQKPLIGFFAVFLACVLSGFAGVYFEMILKSTAPVSVWMRNIQMCLFSIPFSILASVLQDWKLIVSRGAFEGFDGLVWLMVVWHCFGGLTVAICIKYTSNIAKNFATSLAIILSTIGSIYIFNFIPDFLFMIGTFFVIFSIFLFSSKNPRNVYVSRFKRLFS